MLLFNCLLFAGQERYLIVKGNYYNDVWKTLGERNLDLRYDIKEDKVSIYFKEFITTVAYELDKLDRGIFTALIDKYIEWRNKAIEMEVKLEKTIGDFRLRGYFKLGDDWHSSFPSSWKPCLVTASFLSQNKERHQFVLSFGKIRTRNEYINHKPETLYFDYDDVLILREGLTVEKLMEVKKEVEKKKAIEDAFE